MEEHARIPRPLGTTLLSKEYQENNSDTNINRLFKHIVNQYTLSGFRYNSEPLDIHKFSLLTSIPMHTINQLISESGKDMGTFSNPDQLQDTLASLISLSTNWAIQDKGLINQQIELLLASQGGSYKPFISSEVTKALKTGLDANKNLMEIFKTFSSNSTTNILNIYGENKDQDKQDYITPESAFDLVSTHKPIPSKINKELPSSDTNPENNILSPKDQRINDQALTLDNIDKLFQDHNLGDSPDCLESRTGTASLQKVTQPPGLEAEPEPVSLEAPKKRPNSHEAFESRRGENWEDVDEI